MLGIWKLLHEIAQLFDLNTKNSVFYDFGIEFYGIGKGRDPFVVT